MLSSAGAKELAAPAGLTVLARDAVPCHRVGRGHLQRCHKASSTSRPYASYVRCGATPSRRMRTPTVLPPACAEGQQHQHALRLLRALQRHAMGPDVIAFGATTSVCNKCQQHQQALRLLRAMRRSAIVPVVIACSAAISVCVKSQQHQRALYLLHAMRRQAVASDVVTYSAALRPAASAGLTSPSCEAVPCHRAGCGYLQCCIQRVRVGQQYQRALPLLR